VSDYESSQKKRNFLVGVFVFAAVCALVWLVYKFGDLPSYVSKVNSFQVFVQFPTAQGVQKDTPVRLSGYQIGRVIVVKPPEILENLKTGCRYHQAVAVLRIDKRFTNIPSNADIKVMTRGLGSSYVDIDVDPDSKPEPCIEGRPETAYLQDKMVIQGSAGMTSEFFPEESQQKLEELVGNLNELLTNANMIIGDEANRENFKSSLANLSIAMKQATSTLIEVEKFSVQGSKVLASTDDNIVKLVESTIQTEQQLALMLGQMRQMLENVNSGDGTVGRMISDPRLYESLMESSMELQGVLSELSTFIRQAGEKGLPLKLK
jgi:phospholipid/cholesterol/gamma-HCH transport system substrate-binding protein